VRLALCLLLVLALGLTLPARAVQATGTTYYVDATTGNDSADCLTPATACLTINAAIQRAASGDTVNIAAGTYTENVVIDRSLTLTGADQATTIIDGGAGTEVTINGPADSSLNVTVSNITLQDGTGGLYHQCASNNQCDEGSQITLNNDTVRDNYSGGFGAGIHVLNSALTINNGTITNNQTISGGSGGIYIGTSNGSTFSASLNVTSTAVSANSGPGFGGGVWIDGGNGSVTATFTGSTITGNSADVGGGIYSSGSLTLSTTTVTGNTATYDGGGIYSQQGHATSSLVLNSSTVSDNTVTTPDLGGGGINTQLTNTILIDSTVSDNSVGNGGDGGGIFAYGSGTTLSLLNSHITRNVAPPGAYWPTTAGLTVDQPSSYRGSAGSVIYLQNTTLSGNTVGGSAADCGAWQPGSPYSASPVILTNLGNNSIESTSTCKLAGGLPPATTLIPGGAGTDGLPVINWHKTVTLQVQGCSGGAGSYQISQDGTVIRTGTLTEGPAGTYTASIAPLSPNHGAAAMQYTITCNGTPITTIFGFYIDPSGVVMDSVSGQPLAGATVTLYSAPSPDGPFTVVPNGDPSMSPANQTNPDTSAADGSFGWDVVPGYYQIRAARAGCTSPTDPMQPYVETAVLTVPPPADNLVLTLACSGTMFYPRLDLAHPTLGTLPASYHFGLWDAASSLQGPNAKSLATSPGSAQQASSTGYLYQAGDASPSMALDGEFLSAPLAAQTIPAGAWSVGLGIQASLLNAGAPDYTGYLILNVINGSTGQVRGTLVSAPIGAEKTTEGSEVTAYQVSVQGAAVTVQAGDYLEAEIGVRTLSSSAVQNTTLYTSGTTPITSDDSDTSSADSFIQAPITLTFQ
jgi:predicted outer membrane repeat protein